MPSSSARSRDRRHAAGLGVLSLFVLGVAVWLAGAAVLPGLVPGWRSVVVTSGSMEPAISEGDVVLVSPTGPAIEVGSVVLFSTSTGAVTHRIVDVNGDGTFLTRGDANAAADSTPLRPESVIGRARLVVPNAGLPTLWWNQQAWAPLAATVLLLTVTSAGLAVALDIWRTSAVVTSVRHHPQGPLVATVALFALVLALVGTSTSTSTARAAFSGQDGNGTSSFTASWLTRYHLGTWGPGDQVSTLLLPLANAAPSAASVANLDTDRNADAGLTLEPTDEGLDATDRQHFQIWYEGTGSGLALDGPTQLRVWTAMKNKGEAKKGDLIAGLYDCDVWPVDCQLIGASTAAGNGSWGSGALSWGESVFDFGDPDYTLGAGRFLVIKVVAADVKNEIRLAYNTAAQPSALEVGW